MVDANHVHHIQDLHLMDFNVCQIIVIHNKNYCQMENVKIAHLIPGNKEMAKYAFQTSVILDKSYCETVHV